MRCMGIWSESSGIMGVRLASPVFFVQSSSPSRPTLPKSVRSDSEIQDDDRTGSGKACLQSPRVVRNLNGHPDGHLQKKTPPKSGVSTANSMDLMSCDGHPNPEDTRENRPNSNGFIH